MIQIQQTTADGRAYPDFLMRHVQDVWASVELPIVDPDVCLKVDSALSYCGCVEPTARLRQMVYLYQQSHDFDHETVALLVRIARYADDDAACWDDIVAIEFERDCGLDRDSYLEALTAVARRVEADELLVQELMTA